MLRRVAGRLGSLLFVLWGVSLITFVLSHVIPADPARAAAGQNASPAAVATVRHQYGLDLPLPEQYGRYMLDLLHGDFGQSIHTHRAVAADLADYFPATAELSSLALLMVLAFGVPLGVVAALKRDGLLDQGSRLLALGGVSIPIFWLGMLLQILVYAKLGWLPLDGRLDDVLDPPRQRTGFYVIDSLISGNWDDLGNSLQHLVLPAITLALGSLATITRMTRAAMLEVLRHDYIRTARAKGLPGHRVFLRHALRNALIPTMTMVGLQAGGMLSGVFLVEVIFSWPGIGAYAVQSIVALDFPAILGVSLLVAVVYVGINTAVDLLYGVIDPRIGTGLA